MRKSHKITLSISVIILILGILLVGIGIANNASRNVVIGNMNFGINGFGYRGDKEILYDEDIKEIKSINIDSDISTISVIRGEDFHIYEEISKNYIHKIDKTYDISEEGELKIRRKAPRRKKTLLFGSDDYGRIEITIPEKIKLENIEIRTNVGEIELEEVNSKRMYIKTNVGEASGYEVSSDSMEIITDVGEINFDKSKTKNLKADANVGQIDFYGEIKGNIEVKTDIGEANLDLIGDINDYNINGSSKVGSIKINGENLSLFKKYRENSKERPFNIDLKSGVGDIKIEMN